MGYGPQGLRPTGATAHRGSGLRPTGAMAHRGYGPQRLGLRPAGASSVSFVRGYRPQGFNPQGYRPQGYGPEGATAHSDYCPQSPEQRHRRRVQRPRRPPQRPRRLSQRPRRRENDLVVASVQSSAVVETNDLVVQSEVVVGSNAPVFRVANSSPRPTARRPEQRPCRRVVQSSVVVEKSNDPVVHNSSVRATSSSGKTTSSSRATT